MVNEASGRGDWVRPIIVVATSVFGLVTYMYAHFATTHDHHEYMPRDVHNVELQAIKERLVSIDDQLKEMRRVAKSE